MEPLRVDVLVYSDCLGSEAFALRDTLVMANQLAAGQHFDVAVVSVDGASVSAGGIVLNPARARRNPQMLIVPGMMTQGSADLIARTHRLSAECAHIHAVHGRGARIGAICVGAFLAAASGVCKGRRVTTAWPVAAALKRWRDDLVVAHEHMVLLDGPLITTGAITAAFDLALALVAERSGPDAALRLRKFLALDGDRNNQLRYECALAEPHQADAIVDRAQRMLQHSLADGFDLARLAHACASSTRTLLRRFKAATGASPLAYRQRLVVETVKALLETTTLPLAHIPARVGYADEASLRRLFRSHTRMTFKDYRQRFGLLRAHHNGRG